MKNTLTLILAILLFSAASGQEKKENFDNFFFEFSNDKEFQISRIKFPLEFVTWENPLEIGGEIVTQSIKLEEWQHDYFYMNQSYRPQIFDNFEGELSDTDERLFQWIGIETGANVNFFFKRINGKWLLIKKEQLGD